MLKIELKGDTAIVAEFQEYPGRTRRALVRALNRAIGSARTVIVRSIAEDTGMRAKDVREALRMEEATSQRPVARLAASLKPIPLIAFSARGPEPSRGRGRGVAWRLKGSRGRDPHAFIATMRSGHRGVFKRADEFSDNPRPMDHKSRGAWSKNLPIREMHGPSLGKVFAKYRPLGLERALESFKTNFDHEMHYERTIAPGADAGGTD